MLVTLRHIQTNQLFTVIVEEVKHERDPWSTDSEIEWKIVRNGVTSYIFIV